MMREPVRETQAMIAGMSPVLQRDLFVFGSTRDEAVISAAQADAIATFREEEGLSLILPLEAALRLGFAADLPMQQITLNVLSDLAGVGLTAAVSGALAAHGIACNMVAAFHHDHVFVPAADADRALAILKDRAKDQAGT